ncbi:hypothetical protein ASPFODRAFT_44651 [Aspergillus luchuensis CBS 106.47]|uniref:Uncharacterized protein n=1 Tax=Aspergillus luchuensis (strain CBS 106.47) TaxID=1137211 RepID=A0A1M3TK22_ASPLC|nr:hypothetical protein ASPFODRAFT_44651 [Aspergillus luchuensis CBS 106.47]
MCDVGTGNMLLLKTKDIVIKHWTKTHFVLLCTTLAGVGSVLYANVYGVPAVSLYYIGVNH